MERGKSFTRVGVPELLDRIGRGKLVGKLIVDQVYARYQHERLDLRHPRGGGPKYLQRPLFEHYREYLQKLAEAVPDGNLVSAMASCMESLNGAMSRSAPVLANNLRRSGNPRVYDNGRLVYNRSAWQRRLSKGELRVLRPRRTGRRRRG